MKNTNVFNNILRGDIYYADLTGAIGSEQAGKRPVLIIQNDIGNRHSPTVIVAPITSKTTKKKLPTHILLSKDSEFCLPKNATVLLEQIRTLDKSRLDNYLTSIKCSELEKINEALRISLGN